MQSSTRLLLASEFSLLRANYSEQQGVFSIKNSRAYCRLRASPDRGLNSRNVEVFFAKLHAPGCLLLDGRIVSDRTAAKRGDIAAVLGLEFPQE